MENEFTLDVQIIELLVLSGCWLDPTNQQVLRVLVYWEKDNDTDQPVLTCSICLFHEFWF